jgi:hypothetical protein
MKKLLLGAAMLGATAFAGSLQAAEQDRRAAAMAAMFPDPDGDGATSREEMLAASDARFASLDANKDGKLATAETTGPGSRMLARADTDGDGQVSQAEMRTATGKRFDRLDANRDGKVDAAEREAARQRMMQRRGGE